MSHVMIVRERSVRWNPFHLIVTCNVVLVPLEGESKKYARNVFYSLRMRTMMSDGLQGSPMLKMFHEVPLYVSKIHACAIVDAYSLPFVL